MAVFPCDWSGHRYPGKQQSVYVTSAWGSDVETAKLRLCPTHRDELYESCSDKMTEVSEDTPVGRTCDACDQDRTAALFVRFYAEDGTVEQFAADLCAAHWQAYRTLVKVASGRAM